MFFFKHPCMLYPWIKCTARTGFRFDLLLHRAIVWGNRSLFGWIMHNPNPETWAK